MKGVEAQNCSFSKRKSAGPGQGNGDCNARVPHKYGLGPLPLSAWQRGDVPVLLVGKTHAQPVRVLRATMDHL